MSHPRSGVQGCPGATTDERCVACMAHTAAANRRGGVLWNGKVGYVWVSTSLMKAAISFLQRSAACMSTMCPTSGMITSLDPEMAS